MGISISLGCRRNRKNKENEDTALPVPIDPPFHDPYAGFPDMFLIRAVRVGERDVSKPVAEAILIDIEGKPISNGIRRNPPRRV